MDYLHTFLDSFEPMRRAKVEKTLNTQVRRNGNNFAKRYKHVEHMVFSENYRIANHRKYGDILERNDGVFMAADQITKTAIDYAKFLLNKG